MQSGRTLRQRLSATLPWVIVVVAVTAVPLWAEEPQGDADLARAQGLLEEASGHLQTDQRDTAEATARDALEATPAGAEGQRLRLAARGLLARIAALRFADGSGSLEAVPGRCGACKSDPSWQKCSECAGKGQVDRKIRKVIMRGNRRVTRYETVKKPCSNCETRGRVVCAKCYGLESKLPKLRGAERSRLSELSQLTLGLCQATGRDGELARVLQRVTRQVIRKEPDSLLGLVPRYGASKGLRGKLGELLSSEPDEKAVSSWRSLGYQIRANFLLSYAVELAQRLAALGLSRRALALDPVELAQVGPLLGPAELACDPERGEEDAVAVRGLLTAALPVKKGRLACGLGGPGPFDQPGDTMAARRLWLGLVSGADHDLAVYAWTPRASQDLQVLSQAQGAGWMRSLLESYDFDLAARLADLINGPTRHEVVLRGRLIGPRDESPRLAFEVWSLDVPEHGGLVTPLAESLTVARAAKRPSLELLGEVGQPLGLTGLSGGQPFGAPLKRVSRAAALLDLSLAAGLPLGARDGRLVLGEAARHREVALFQRLAQAALALNAHERGLSRSGFGPGSAPDPSGSGDLEPAPPAAPAPEAKGPALAPDSRAFLKAFLRVEPQFNQGRVTLIYDFESAEQLEDFNHQSLGRVEVQDGGLILASASSQLGRVIHRLPLVGGVKIEARVRFESFTAPSRLGLTFFEQPTQADWESVVLFEYRKAFGKQERRLSARAEQVRRSRRGVRKGNAAPYKKFRQGAQYDLVLDAQPTQVTLTQDGKALLGARLTGEGKGQVGFEVFTCRVVVERLTISGMVDGRWLAEQLRGGG